MSDQSLRARIAGLLAEGLETRWPERADTSEQVLATTQALSHLAPDELTAKLVTAGFTAQAVVVPGAFDPIEPACATCMYYERHRRFCALPELMLPVEPEWSCVLWRI